MIKITNGIYQCPFGEQEAFNASHFRLKKPKTEALNDLSDTPLPFKEDDIIFKKTSRGITVEIPMKTGEEVYGFGLQLKSFNNAGRKKFLRTNADPVADTGDSHAPVPFYVSTYDGGCAYGLLVDTVKYTTFYCGSSRKIQKEKAPAVVEDYTVKTTVEELYSSVDRTDMNMLIEVEHVSGCLIYLFTGETVEEVCRKYILFSGGGCLPPLYGLG
ncbi:MAG: glycoside hydrolase, partial [Clostridia bacterium]|nr:glycoside hydrolase [Clostridia bacterium]